MTFPQSPYNVHVGKVQDGGADVSGAQFKLENITKSTEKLKTSNESDSNITINVAECGDWDTGDVIKITATYGGKNGSSTHTIAVGDYGEHDFGTLPLLSGEWKMVLFSDDDTPITVRKNSGIDIGTRPRLNLIEGNNVSLDVIDDATSDEIDITIAAIGGTTYWEVSGTELQMVSVRDMDMQQKELVAAAIETLTAAERGALSPVTAQLCYDTDDSHLWINI